MHKNIADVPAIRRESEENMKYFKIYAECCTVPKGMGIMEISEAMVNSLICDAVLDMVDNGDIEISGETDDEISENYNLMFDKAIDYFKNNGYFKCGDFEVRIIDDEVPYRPYSCGYTDFI